MLKSIHHRGYLRSFLAGLSLLLVIITILNMSDIIIFPTVYRVTYAVVFDSTLFPFYQMDFLVLGAIVSYLSIDLTRPHKRSYLQISTLSVLWISIGLSLVTDFKFLIFIAITISAFILATVILASYFFKKTNTQLLLVDSTSYLFFILPFMLIEIASLITWIMYPLVPSQIYANESWWFARIASDIHYAFGRISPFLLLSLITSFVISYLLSVTRVFTKNFLLNILSRIEAASFASYTGEFLTQKINRIILIASIISSSLMILYPYITTINPDGTPIATDIPIYVELIGQLKENAVNDDQLASIITAAFTTVAGGDRPLSLIAIYLFQLSTGLDLLVVLKYLPMILAPLTTLTVFFFVKSFSRYYASFAAFFTVFSFQVLSGIYAGFYANWMALILFYITMWMCVIFLEKRSKLIFALLIISSVSTLFFHIYTWGVLLITLITFALIQAPAAIKTKSWTSTRGLIMISLVIVGNIVVDFTRIQILEVKGGLVKDVELLEELGGWHDFQIRWSNLSYLFSVYLGGTMMNSIMLIFAVYASIFLIKKEGYFPKILLASVYGAAIPIIFGNYNLQARVIFDLPVHVLAAIGFADILNRIYAKYGIYFAGPIFLLVVVNFANYLLRNLSNLFLKLT